MLEEIGVVGGKIDFMDSESQPMLKFYEECGRDAAKHHIMLNFHGANKPAGEARTWPNEMTREGICGQSCESTIAFETFRAGSILSAARLTNNQNHLLMDWQVTGRGFADNQ